MEFVPGSGQITVEELTGRPASYVARSGRCDIKRNIGKSGARIYRVPGGRYDDRTRIDTSEGERW